MIGGKLKQHMAKRHMTPEALVVALADNGLAVTAHAVRRWLRDERVPRAETLLAIASVLRCRAQELIQQ